MWFKTLSVCLFLMANLNIFCSLVFYLGGIEHMARAQPGRIGGGGGIGGGVLLFETFSGECAAQFFKL